MIHIASEVVVLLGMTFYFSSKNKALQGHIENLSQRLEEQEDRIQKLENTMEQFKQIPARLNESMVAMSQNVRECMEKVEAREAKQAMSVVERAFKPKRVMRKPEVKPVPVRTKHTTPMIKEIKEPVKTTQVQFSETLGQSTRSSVDSSGPKVLVQNQPEPEDENSDVNDDISDSELDNEIQEELNELTEDENSLKKQT
jgi:hypothetical protein